MPGTDLLLIDGGEKARRRGPRGQDVTPAQIETFLITLGDTCNVALSARKAGFSQSWAYRLRKRDASFRAGWAEAVREGYAKLELVLLERAMKGTPKPIARSAGERVGDGRACRGRAVRAGRCTRAEGHIGERIDDRHRHDGDRLRPRQ